VYANQEAIYVTCTGISLLGHHTLVLTGEDSSQVLPMVASSDDDILDVTNRPGRSPDTIPEVEALLARVREERRLPTREERRKMRVLLRKDRAPSLLRNASEVERCEARFRYLCRLLVRDRAPYVPLNGILVLLPFAAADTDQDALDTGTACQRDLALARQVLQVNCPVFALICDLESAPGFAEFLELFPAKQRHQRMGQHCPMIPDLTLAAGRSGNVTEARAAMLDSLATWICSSVVPGWVYKNFRLEEPGEPNIRKLVHNNARLFLLLHELRERRLRLGRVLERSLAVDGEPIWFGGCYLGATGIDPDHEQGFVAGVFRRLAEEEKRGLVSWTPEALQEEAQYQHWALLGQITLALLILATAGLIGYIFFGPGSKS